MKKMLPVLVSIIILFAVSMAFVTVDTSTAAEMKGMADQEVDLEAAKVTFEDVCSRCHDPSRALNKKKDKEGWEKTVVRMASYHEKRKGSSISAEDQNAIIQYLVEVAGK